MTTTPSPKIDASLCAMFGISPARLLTEKDIARLYKGMPLVAKAIWANVKKSQGV